ncbi:MAG TPA: amylo-alpha-1,6-glucosidase [Candidatus Saccharimonadales bacterium]|nr:amylo-alpha-1,6-glucosidase [Candidatus Saccharimonadales bacterium]
MEQPEITNKLPADIRLLPGERLLNVIYHEPRIFEHLPSSLEQILRLTRAKNSEEIGKYGPSVAALSFDSDAPEHLHLYEVVFGRDSLRVAIDLISSYPELARMTVLKLAELQGVEYNTEREEEPGRIVHEARDKDDPIAQDLSERLGWGWPYYGSVDATPEFIRTLAGYCSISDAHATFLSQQFRAKNGEIKTIADALISSVSWITRRLDSNVEGILEFKSALPQGIENQVWKDSWDAYHHSDGTLANHGAGIASIEVQVTTYDALLEAADIYERYLSKVTEAGQLRERAEQLRQTTLKTFWCNDKGGYFVLGTDRDELGNLRPLRIRTSNMGHALNSRLLDGEDPELIHRRTTLVNQLLSPEMLNIAGIRTLATDEVRYRPGSYHNGSVWLWDTHHIAKGMRRLGFKEEADDLDRRILKVIEATKIFPEYVRGDSITEPRLNTRTVNIWDETYQRINKLEQPPQEVQAWTVAAILATKKRLERRGLM